MSAALNFIGLTPEFWLFGFLPAVYTHDWKTGLALTFIIEYAVNLFAVHGADATDAASATDLLFMATTTHATAAFFGAIVGSAFVWATGFPAVFNIDIFFGGSAARPAPNGGHLFAAVGRDKNNRSNDGFAPSPWQQSKPYIWSFIGLVLPLTFVYTAILFFIGRFTMVGPAYSISQGLSNLFGGVLLGVAVLLLLLYLAAVLLDWPSARLPDGHSHSALLNLKYAWLFVLAMATPVVFDFTNDLSQAARFGLHIAAALVVYLLTAWLGRYDRYLGPDSGASIGRTFGTLLLLWLVQVSMYTSAAVFTSQNSIFIWVAVWSLGWTVVFLAVGYMRAAPESVRLHRKRANPAAYSLA